MKEIRDIKIDMLMGNENPIVDLFHKITDGIRVINCDVYNRDGQEFIYFNKEKEWIFFQDHENGRFWGNHTRYWSLFETKFGLRYNEIQELTKLLVEEALKRPRISIGLNAVMADIVWEKRYDVFGLEEVLKRNVGIGNRLRRKGSRADKRNYIG